MAQNAELDHGKWPMGSGRIPIAFNPGWKTNGIAAVYLPCDRVALATHPEWLTQHAPLAWQADKDITFYLGIIHDYLNSPEYTGTRSPAT